MRSGETWILVADAAAARFFRADRPGRRLELVREVKHNERRAKASALVADRQGRSLNSSHLGGRHAMEPDTDPKLIELRRFARQLAGELGAAASAGRFQHLVVVAGPRLLGELRRAMPDRVAELVGHQLGKDLAHLSPTELEGSLRSVLWP